MNVQICLLTIKHLFLKNKTKPKQNNKPRHFTTKTSVVQVLTRWGAGGGAGGGGAGGKSHDQLYIASMPAPVHLFFLRLP